MADIDPRCPAGTRRSLISVRALKRQLREIRTRRLAYDDCESNASVARVAAMSISVPTIRRSEQVAQRCVELVTTGAGTLSARLGHTGPPATHRP